MTTYVIEDINPIPWTAPNLSVGRSGGKVFPRAYKAAELTAYQEAIKEWFADARPDIEPAECEVDVVFRLWRELPANELDGRKLRKHIADATNMQKALEDALQGVLFKNDRQVRRITTTIVEQSADTSPRIEIEIKPWGWSS